MVSEDLDALRRENARLEAILDGGLRQRLLTEFGAQHVAVGLKKQRGVVSDELVILAYVAEKLPPDQVPSGQLIPAEIDGVHTDVDVPKQFTFADSSKYRPVVGGIQITNGIEDFDSGGHLTMEGGTLGCLATNADGKTVLLSNWHVLSANSGKKGDAVYQPLPVHDGPPPSLGETPKRPTSSDNAIAKITDLQVSADVDCGIATINTCYSLCCNCGVHFDNRIQGLAINSSDVITDVGVAVAGQQVVKVGSVTGRTVGKIRTLTAAPITIKRDGTNYTFTNQIEITPVSGPIFSDHGDSGAAIIGLTDGKIIGLLFATDADPSDPSTAANDINKVISALKINDLNVTKAGCAWLLLGRARDPGRHRTRQLARSPGRPTVAHRRRTGSAGRAGTPPRRDDRAGEQRPAGDGDLAPAPRPAMAGPRRPAGAPSRLRATRDGRRCLAARAVAGHGRCAHAGRQRSAHRRDRPSTRAGRAATRPRHRRGRPVLHRRRRLICAHGRL